MNQIRQTRLLALLVLLALVVTAIGHARLSDSKSAAALAADNLRECRQRLAELHRWRAGVGEGAGEQSVVATDTSELSRLLRTAAADAGAGQKLVSVEPGRPGTADGGVAQLPVFLRLESVSLRELTMFLHRLATIDASSRVQSIELTAASGADDSPGAAELWNADVTIHYANFAAGERQP